MDKLNAIVVGAYPKFVDKIKKRLSPILDEFRLIQTDGRINLNKDFYPEATIVIVLTDYVSRIGLEAANRIARSRDIGFLKVKSENYVKDALTQLKNSVGKCNASPAPITPKPPAPQLQAPAPAPTPEPAPEPVRETVTGITPDKIWETYGEQMKEFTRVILEPGKYYHEKDLLSFMSSEVGLPEGDLKPFLGELAVRGLITRAGTDTWKRPGGNDDEVLVNDKTEVKAKLPFRKETITDKIRGIGPGPFNSKWSAAMELLKYKDFRTKDGRRPSPSYCMVMMQGAIDKGYVEERDGKIYVLVDPKVKLESDPEYKPQVKKAAGRPKKVVEPKGKAAKSNVDELPTTYTSLVDLQKQAHKEEPKPGKADKSSEEAERPLRSMLGTIAPASLLPGHIRALKNLMPPMHWDESAFREISSRLAKLGRPGRAIPKSAFTETEWDSLAWAHISRLPLAVVVPTWRLEVFEDKKLICVDCKESFVFTASEQDRFFKLFGEVTPPKRCPWCRKIHKQIGNDDGPDQDRILRRHGG